jgi:hypothetical protein
MEQRSERIEVRVSRRTLFVLQQQARAGDISVEELIRSAIDDLVQQDSTVRIQAAQSLFGVDAPVSDWPEMEQEIEEARATQLEE